LALYVSLFSSTKSKILALYVSLFSSTKTKCRMHKMYQKTIERHTSGYNKNEKSTANILGLITL